MTFVILIFTFEIIIFQLISRDLIKLSNLSNYVEYSKGLVLIIIHTTPFYTTEDIFNTGVNSSKLHDNILYEYLIRNDINFYPSLLREKGGFLMVGVRVRVMDADIKSNLAEK